MKCPKCGENIADSAKFCTKCGANIPEILEGKAKIEAEEEKKRIEAEEAKRKAEEEKKRIEAEEAKRKAEEEKKRIETEEAAKKADEDKIKEETTKKAEEETSKGAEKEEENNEIAKEKVKVEAKREKNVKQKKTKKKHTGLKLIFILILILIILCAGSYGLYKIDLLPDSVKEVVSPIIETVEGWFGIEEDDEKEDEKKDKKNESDIDEDDDEDKDENKINKLDENEDLVFDYYNKKILGNTYKVPKINIDSADVKKYNKEIAKLVDSDLEELEDETEIPEMAPVSMDYIWTQNDNILSLVFFITGYHMDYYYVYNIDVYTGESIENEDVLDAAKIDEDDFAEMCSDAVKDYYENYLYYKGIEDSTDVGYEYRSAKSESIKESNFGVSKTDMFLNKNGELMIIAKLTTIAGAGTAYAPVNIENLKKNSKPLFESRSLPNSSEMEEDKSTTNTTNTTNTTEKVDNTVANNTVVNNVVE